MTAPTPLRLIAAGLLLLLAGCTSPDSRWSDLGPVYTPTNVRGPAIWPAAVRRVAVLPAHDISGRLTPEFTARYDGSWHRALNRTQRAEFVGISRPNLAAWTGSESLSSTSLLPTNLLERVARETGAQAVLFLDLTHCTPYPPLALSFRARLVDAATGETIWMADEQFDASTDPAARAARHYARDNSSGTGDRTEGVLLSPARFADYAFQAVTTLLPPHLATIGKPH